MPEPLWSAAAHEAIAGDPKAAAADLVLAVRYCRSMLPNLDSNPNGWMLTIQTIQECAENHKLNGADCKTLLAELPEVAAMRQQVAEKLKQQLVVDIAQVANMEVPYRKLDVSIQGIQVFGPVKPAPPCGTLDRETTARLFIETAAGDVANALRSRGEYSDASFKRIKSLRARLPNPNRIEAEFQGKQRSGAAVESARAKVIPTFVARMNALPNSLGLWFLHANGPSEFAADWQLEEHLDQARKALAAGSTS